jgi:hypothetical protein
VPVSLIVPFRGDCPHRAAAWAWLKRRWRDQHPDWELVEGTCHTPRWVKALAVHDAVLRSSGGTLVIADADVWVDRIEIGENWSVPHYLVHRLTGTGTERFMAGEPVGRADLVQRAYKGHVGGGVVVLPRDLWYEVPLDPRFEGWGHEDDSWNHALTTVAGKPERGDADLYHLWHPPQERHTRGWGSHESRALYRRYRGATPQGMSVLLTEAKELLP